MTDRDIIKQLNTLKEIEPETAWKSSNRDILLSQISNSGARKLTAWEILLINTGSFFKTAAQPAYALGVFIFVMIGAGLYSHQAFTQTKPNDSLYIARVVSERAKLSTVLNSNDRNKLAVKFSLEHAKDISTVLADPSFNNDSNQDQVARLSESFNRELENVKSRISYLKPKAPVQVGDNSELVATTSYEGEAFSMAGVEKTDAGLQVFPGSLEINETPEMATTASTSTSEAPTSSTVIEVASPASILEEARQYSDNKDYLKASEKLKEVSELIK
jgi:hypothetical protein